jgi:hypothetical protein
MKNNSPGFLQILAAMIAVSLSFNFLANGQDDNTGIFKTSDDYLNHNLTVYSLLTLKHNTFKGVYNGTKIPSTPYKEANFWGVEDDNGLKYRINKKANVADQIIGKGEIWYYAGQELVIERYNDGEVSGMGINAVKGTKFSDVFWFSKGGDGEMIGASFENLSLLFADTPGVLAKLKDKGIDETNIDKWVENFKNVNNWIGEYEKTHPK